MTEQPSPDLEVERHRIVSMVQGSLGEPGVTLGRPGRCRYCGTTDGTAFRTVAHAFPEAFGNKWITSLDECDRCNSTFGAFDDALAKSMGAVLTVGGTQGKHNRVRQTGRTDGPASIRHAVVDGRRSISMRASGTPFGNHFGVIPSTGELVLSVPAGTERFVPAKAYKALVKMALALLPDDRVADFSEAISWLKSSDDELLPDMTVGLAFAMVGNAPPLLAAALLQRSDGSSDHPDLVFITTLGSVCFQIALHRDGCRSDPTAGSASRPRVVWTNVLQPPGEEPILIVYGEPVHLDWRRAALEPSAVESIRTIIDPRTGEARMTAVVRRSGLAHPA